VVCLGGGTGETGGSTTITALPTSIQIEPGLPSTQLVSPAPAVQETAAPADRRNPLCCPALGVALLPVIWMALRRK
jgi:hypothetical protein